VSSENINKLAAIILAAGKSTRMGDKNKLLLPFGDNTILGAVVSEVVKTDIDQIFIVTGNEESRVRDAIAHDVKFIHNPDFADGLSTSIKAGVGALSDEVGGVMILLGDMPFVSHEDLNALIDVFDKGKIIVPTHDGEIGNPLIFAAEFFDEFKSLDGDKGARKLLVKHPDKITHVEISSAGIFTDVDNLQAYEQAKVEYQSPS